MSYLDECDEVLAQVEAMATEDGTAERVTRVNSQKAIHFRSGGSIRFRSTSATSSRTVGRSSGGGARLVVAAAGDHQLDPAFTQGEDAFPLLARGVARHDNLAVDT